LSQVFLLPSTLETSFSVTVETKLALSGSAASRGRRVPISVQYHVKIGSSRRGLARFSCATSLSESAGQDRNTGAGAESQEGIKVPIAFSSRRRVFRYPGMGVNLSDPTLNFGEKSWKIHKALVCSHSKLVHNAINGGFKVSVSKFKQNVSLK
jgi:hypothetical protein